MAEIRIEEKRRTNWLPLLLGLALLVALLGWFATRNDAPSTVVPAADNTAGAAVGSAPGAAVPVAPAAPRAP